MKAFRLEMTGLAAMRGSITIEAENEEEACAKAKERSGDILWHYQGMRDETIEAEVADSFNISEEKK